MPARTPAMLDALSWLKSGVAGILAVPLMWLVQIEPHEVNWILAIAGGLLGVALLEDRRWRVLVAHTGIATLCGVLAAQLLPDASGYRLITCFVVAVLSAHVLIAVFRRIEDDGLMAVLTMVSAFFFGRRG